MIIKKVRTILYDTGFPYCFWDEAVRTVIYLINRSLSKALLSSLTSYKVLYKRKPPMIYLDLFRCDTYIYIHSD